MLMQSFFMWLNSQLHDEEGQDLIEYALIIVLIVIVAVVGMSALGPRISAIWGQILTALGGAAS